MDSNAGTITEGFLCPICLQDLNSFHNLQNHFESAHSREDKDGFSQMRGFFSKAKDKILGVEENKNTNKDSILNTNTGTSHTGRSILNKYDPSLWEPQEIGTSKTHIEGFRKSRDARIDGMVIATNKIIIRLEKVLKIIKEGDMSNRKSYEQLIVPWAPDEDVPFCPTCGDKFNVAKRRHHCRLCGAIMCTKCSVFLPFDFAENIVKSLNTVKNSTDKLRNSSPQNTGTSSPSNIDDTKEFTVRSCVECRNVLYRKKERMMKSNSKSLLEQLYKKMLGALQGAESAIKPFTIMANSLNKGESEYRLEIANKDRFELMQMFEAIDVLSRKIESLNVNNEDEPPYDIQIRLQNNIRRMAISFLQEHMLTLPSLPSEPKLKVLQAKYRAEQEKKLRLQRQEAERQRAEEKRLQRLQQLREEQELEKSQADNNAFASSKDEGNSLKRPVSLGVQNKGWSADAVSIMSNASRHSDHHENGNISDDEDLDNNNIDEPMDPILEQITYVRESARQARESGMIEEASSLEKNLEELKTEYRRQQTAKAFMGTPTTEKLCNTFTPSLQTKPDTGEDPLVQQIRYISECIKDAERKQKWDEADMLRDNLKELENIVGPQTNKNI